VVHAPPPPPLPPPPLPHLVCLNDTHDVVDLNELARRDSELDEGLKGF